MLVFYFAILSAITPPVALAVYAANGFSRAPLWESSLAALRLGATGFIIAFMFVFGPSLLMIGAPQTIAVMAITAALGVICLAAGFSGYLIGLASAWQRVLLLAAALVLIKPGVVTDAIGIALFGIVFATQWLAAKAARIRSI